MSENNLPADTNFSCTSVTILQIFGMSVLVVAGVFLLCLGMTIPKNHAWVWHNTVVHSINISLICLDAGLFIRTQVQENGDDKHLLRDLLVVLVETLITIYRFVESMGKTHSPWDAEKILHLVGASLPVLIGTSQIGWIVYKALTKPKVMVGWLGKIHQVYARKRELAAGATIGGNGGRDGGSQVANESIEVRNDQPVNIGASQVGWISYTAGIQFKFIKWFRKNLGVSAVEAEQSAGAAMEKYGGGDSGQQVQEEELKVVVASPA
ncbi:uncharacterized protein LOC124664404 [Lolium rigidum]|uniref:uncharacterized protein LOC124664404 n=1 Tax=Lolium rigidum TaxID=89674 RepID=UPI001F5CF8DA|nr:uncharacterized protein LOC124664404 [Lolium rigidum]